MELLIEYHFDLSPVVGYSCTFHFFLLTLLVVPDGAHRGFPNQKKSKKRLWAYTVTPL